MLVRFKLELQEGERHITASRSRIIEAKNFDEAMEALHGDIMRTLAALRVELTTLLPDVDSVG